MINVIDEEENIHPVTFSDELNHKILNHGQMKILRTC